MRRRRKVHLRRTFVECRRVKLFLPPAGRREAVLPNLYKYNVSEKNCVAVA